MTQSVLLPPKLLLVIQHVHGVIDDGDLEAAPVVECSPTGVWDVLLLRRDGTRLCALCGAELVGDVPTDVLSELLTQPLIAVHVCVSCSRARPRAAPAPS